MEENNLGGLYMSLYDDDIFAPLRREFAAELPVRLESLRAHFDAWKSSSADESRDGMIHEAHKLAGTAGALGFDGIGDEMCNIERMLRGNGTPAVMNEESCAILEKSIGSCYRQAGLDLPASESSPSREREDA